MNKSESKWVGIFALLSTVFLLVAGVAYLNVPYEQKLIIFSQRYFDSFSQTPWPYYIFWSGMILHAMFMIGVISCFRKISHALHHDVFKFVSILAIIGYSIMMLTYASRLHYMPRITHAFMAGDETTKTVIIALGTMEFDKFILAFLLSSVWFFTLSVLSYTHKIMHKAIIWVQVLIGSGYLCGLIGYLAQIRTLISILMILFLLFPVWSFYWYINTRHSVAK